MQENVTPQVLKPIFDLISETIVWVLPVVNSDETVVDFEVAFANKAADEAAMHPNGQLTGLRILRDGIPSHRGAEENFQSNLQVYQSGATASYSFVAHHSGRLMDVERRPYAGGVLSTAQDRRGERKAREQEQSTRRMFDSIVDAAPVGIIVYKAMRNEAGIITDFFVLHHNRDSVVLTGIKDAERKSQTLQEVLKRLKTEHLFSTYAEVVEQGNSFHMEAYLEASGKWVTSSAVKLDDGFVVMLTDITALKQGQEVQQAQLTSIKEVQARVEKAATRLEAVFTAAQHGMLIFTPVTDAQGEIIDFRFVITNPSFAAYVGQTPEVLNGALGSEYFPGYLHNGVFDMYKNTYLTGTAHRRDVHYNVDGLDLYLDLQSMKVHDEVLVSFTDYTALKKAQQQLEASLLEQQQLNANLEQFAYAASHDLKEPLRKITFFSERLNEKLKNRLTEEEQRFMDRIQNATKRITLLVDDLLEYSYISKGLDSTEEIDLNKKLQLVLDDLELTIREKSASFQIDQLPTICGHRRQVQQLFQNLISNALKYSKAEETPFIRISAQQISGRDAGTVLREEDASRKYYLIEIKDNGIGFEQGDAERIFNVFTRLHGIGEYSGSGVGLSIVRKVVENHNGYIWAESEPGSGATFKILLPVTES